MKIMRLVLNVLYPILTVILMSAACSNGGADAASNETAEDGAAANSESGSTEAQVAKMLGAREEKPILIQGKVNGHNNQPLYLQIVEAQGVRPVDTVTTGANGEYKFERKVDHVDFYRVAANEQNSFYLVIEPGETVTADADVFNMFKSYKVNGSHGSSRMKKMNQITGQLDSVNMILQAAQMNQDQQMFNSALTAHQNTQIKMQREIKAFINEEPNNLSSLAALQNLNPDADFDYYEKVINALNGTANGVDIYDKMSAEVLAMRATAPGRIAPDISLPQPNGEILKLSDLRGKYVMIDFWASWCGPCRRENPNVKRIYDRFHSKGFEIYGVSLDKNMQAWLQAIEQDGLNWQHVSDLKYWQSEVVPIYQVTGIPMTVLLDPEGKIIAKNLRGEELENKLASLLEE